MDNINVSEEDILPGYIEEKSSINSKIKWNCDFLSKNKNILRRH
jgi:hypothetical protein